MVTHLTPLRRNQLLDLEALVESVLHSSHPSFSSIPSPVSNRFLPSPQHTHRTGPSPLSASSSSFPAEHPFSCGTFCDVFADPATRDVWRLHDKMLYLVWWSHRPSCCGECGMRDAWLPSAESEMICRHCGAAAGTTTLNDVVEDLPDAETNDDDGGGSDGGHFAFSGENEGGGYGEGLRTGGAVALYTLFFEWLARVRLAEGGKGVVVPAGSGLAAVLRAAHDLSQLFLVPGLPRGGAGAAVRGGALYLSLVLHRYPVPFPLFCHAGQNARENDTETPETTTTTTTTATTTGTTAATAAATGPTVEAREEMQWVDVELLAACIGVSLSDFFEGPQVALQYLQNVMAVAAEYAVPSVLWHPQRVEGRAIYVQEELRQRRAASPAWASSSLSLSSGGLAPEHTAMLVALELARVVDAQPCSAAHAARIGQWLDRMGLFPSRTAAYGRTMSATPHCPAAVEDKTWATEPLTTADSLFAGEFCLILPSSPCANALLHVFARAFAMTALEITDMAVRSGIYGGPTRFLDVLREAAEMGDYSRMPLARRLSPMTSTWMSTYFALHSDDRLPLLAALQHVRGAVTRDGELPAARVVQRILRKHQATRRYQFNYTIRVAAGEESDRQQQQLQGLYFLSYVSDRVAVFTAVRSARKTLAFDNETGRITLFTAGSREQYVETLDAQFSGPIEVHIETESAKCAMDCVRHGIGATEWQAAVRNFDRCGRVRRRMRVPMLASRLDALASVREATAAASHFATGPHLGLNSNANGSVNGGATLLGWGDTEALLTTALPAVIDAAGLRGEVQRNLLSLPRPSLVLGISENRVTALYASLVALLEHVEQQLAQRRAGLPVKSSLRITSGQSWVDVLLATENDEGYVNGESNENDFVSHMDYTLPAPTAVQQQQQHQQQQQQQQCQPHQSLNAVLGVVPSYKDVLLDKSATSRMSPASRSRHSRHRRSVSQSRPRDGSLRSTDHSQPNRNGGHGENSADGNVSSPAGEPFHLFCAEECRRRLHRLLQFVAAYSAARRAAAVPKNNFPAGLSPKNLSPKMQAQQRTPKASPLCNDFSAPAPLSLSAGGKTNTSPALHPSAPKTRSTGRSPKLNSATPPRDQPNINNNHNNNNSHHHQQQQQQQRRRRVSRLDKSADSSDGSEGGRYSVLLKRERERSSDNDANGYGEFAYNQEQQRNPQRGSGSRSDFSSDNEGGGKMSGVAAEHIIVMEAITHGLWRVWNIPSTFNGDFASIMFDKYADIPVYCCVLYILLVFVVPEQVMKNREPFRLRVPFIFWNLGLCVFSVFGTLSSFELMNILMKEHGFYKTTCFLDREKLYNGRYGFWLYYFLLSKIPELVDTVFLVLQKKPVIFLHWYHHLTVLVFCWHAGSVLIPSGLWFGAMNYFVHAIMYFYYFMCACGLRKVIRPIAPLITTLQILQMVMGTFIVVYTTYHRHISGYGCDVDDINLRLGLAMYGSYFVLFSVLFYNLYLHKHKKEVPKENGHRSVRNGAKHG